MTPSKDQLTLADLPVGNILVVAPPGCGKTQALAHRALAVVDRGEVSLPYKVLGLTFSNKARDNLAARLTSLAGYRWRKHITVVNFHGLGARIIKAHGRLIGISADVVLPESRWRKGQLKDLGITYHSMAAFERVLRKAKSNRVTDEQVMAALLATGHSAAIEFEKRLRRENRLDYDDVIRHAGRLLADERVRALYRAHFGMVLVDEVQDLSMPQYEIVRWVGGDTVTYAGDPSQGIYAFAGAQPVEVFERIEQLEHERMELKTSYRSAPAVLKAVNTLAADMGAPILECGRPEAWPDAGHVVFFDMYDDEDEAFAIVTHIEDLLEQNAAWSIGVIGRRDSRLRYIKELARTRGIDFEDWSMSTHNAQIVALLKRFAPEAAKSTSGDHDALTTLEALCLKEIPSDDVSARDELLEACFDLKEKIDSGASLSDAVALCRVALSPVEPVNSGLHFLTGHKGKGQEFDWAIVPGLEDGHIPDFRSKTARQLCEEQRVLHVMLSRARYGLVLSVCERTRTLASDWRGQTPSRWLTILKDAATVTHISCEPEDY